MEIAAWLILRIVYAWMFLYPLKDLLNNFDATVNTVKLVTPYQPRCCAYVMVLVMLVTSLMILFGIYAQIAGIILIIYNLMGMVVHYRLACRSKHQKLTDAASSEDQKTLSELAKLAFVGHQTSAQKNLVLAAVACFFMLMGSGPLSITPNLF